MTDLVRVERAVVLKKGRRAASLTRMRDRVRMTYDEEYLALGGPAVASTLPLSAEPVEANAAKDTSSTLRASTCAPFTKSAKPSSKRTRTCAEVAAPSRTISRRK